jgi:hypothetical protein
MDSRATEVAHCRLRKIGNFSLRACVGGCYRQSNFHAHPFGVDLVAIFPLFFAQRRREFRAVVASPPNTYDIPSVVMLFRYYTYRQRLTFFRNTLVII